MQLGKQLIIFDVEGTLIDCVQQSLICWRDAFASCGYAFSLEELHRHSGRDPDEMIRMLLSESEAQRLAKQLKDTQGRCYREKYLAKVKPFEDVGLLFRQIKRSGAGTGLATTCSKEELHHYCRLAEITDLVDYFACGEDVSHEKPDPALINLVLKRAKTPAAQAIMIGDTPFDAQAARRAAVKVIGVTCGGFSAPALRAAGCADVCTDAAALLNSLPSSTQ